MNTQTTTWAKYTKILGPTGLYELVLVAVHMENFKDKVERPPGELRVSKSLECGKFSFSALTLLVG